ncbi:cyclic peptide export ABC transporter (plasmid) [Candidatus Fukatsuia symbiotica]|uniref:ABC transporter ATP-binding protein n=1 Tax=Candidatus Fukatsuia symbiotica TaxID=1878942 RepID=A0A2Y9CKH3_9GAMM|nr:cyclic peptide export ABC transporter [Candidatus Fukatsuia symbiotica]AWK15519.1 ABC transporter ATP-binding protein [Candidatus Fukatsuia symbiotica]MEA9445908.1 cyclic peptide export ABC transporter [Candidatus Fukatsuia symbiotica]
MSMIKLLSERAPGAPGLPSLLSAQALAGLAGAGWFTVLTQASGVTGHAQVTSLAALAVCALALFVVAQRYATRQTAARVEFSIHSVRIRLIDKLTRVDLQTFERIGKKHLLSCVEKDMKVMSNATMAVISAGQSIMLFVFTLAYLAYLLPLACAICVVVILLGVFLHLIRLRTIERSTQRAMKAENNLFGLVGHMIGGFKELKLHQRRRREIYDELVGASEHSATLNQKAFGQATDHLILLQSILYILLGLVVFAFPLAGLLQPFLLIRVVTVILFLSVPINHFIGILPMYGQANAAARSIGELEQLLDAAVDVEELSEEVEPVLMSSIELRNVCFAYMAVDGHAFEVGPINLSVQQGQVIFITGSNGSGKSTFMKLLTGLQAPSVGCLFLNGTPLEGVRSLATYRNLFSAVFTDYHLFPRLYGSVPPDPTRVQELLKRLALDGKTRLDGRLFTTLDLSTGQRKRLAHLVALLEDRQVYIFDEWAADQDPNFRRWFYREELPRFKAMGKTVIAVTHDDQYFSNADRWLHFEEGHCEERFPDAALPISIPQSSPFSI